MKDRLDHPTEQEVRNTINRCINYRSRCATVEGGKIPDYTKYLLHGDVVNQTGGDGGAGATGATGGDGGPKSQLDSVLETFIQCHAPNMKPAECLLAAQGDDACGALLADDDDLAKKFKKRVSNVRAEAAVALKKVAPLE